MDKARYHILIFIYCLGSPFFSAGQNVEVSMNRNSILIGQQISYGLKVNLPTSGYKANFSIPDSVLHFDIIRKDEIKAVPGETALEQVITFTSFDSGSWYFPSFPVLITDGSRKATLYSDSVLIKVGYSPADTTGLLRDIKPVMDVHIPDYTLWYILGAVLLALIISYFLYRYFKNRKKKPVPLFKADLSPLDEALRSLQQLEQGDLLIKNQEKVFHTELADIFKRYYSRNRQKNLMNKTTGDILVELKDDGIDTGTISTIAEGLRYTDAVKFARFIPIHTESKNALSLIRKGIEEIAKKVN